MTSPRLRHPIPGNRYRVYLQFEGFPIPRIMVADLLSHHPDPSRPNKHIWVFSLRPIAGTQEIPEHQILDLIPVHPSVKVHAPRKARREER
jgi:hypothetical protein